MRCTSFRTKAAALVLVLAAGCGGDEDPEPKKKEEIPLKSIHTNFFLMAATHRQPTSISKMLFFGKKQSLMKNEAGWNDDAALHRAKQCALQASAC